MRAPPAFETICGPQGSGRSGRLAARLREEAPGRQGCILLDPADHWRGRRAALLPESTVLVRPALISSPACDVLGLLAVMLHKAPGMVAAVDDAEAVVADRRSWSALYAAAAATRTLLIVVAPSASDSLPKAYAPLAGGRAAALASIQG